MLYDAYRELILHEVLIDLSILRYSFFIFSFINLLCQFSQFKTITQWVIAGNTSDTVLTLILIWWWLVLFLGKPCTYIKVTHVSFFVSRVSFVVSLYVCVLCLLCVVSVHAGVRTLVKAKRQCQITQVIMTRSNAKVIFFTKLWGQFNAQTVYGKLLFKSNLNMSTTPWLEK